ncbi:hypothetical protein VNO77_19593 [Canavalia gladiata]|uniref:Uncharacterized protein n=1 Tax=Canavalia gladiata TaxID=3824 RepID=A0AAN9QKL2_CANGL
MLGRSLAFKTKKIEEGVWHSESSQRRRDRERRTFESESFTPPLSRALSVCMQVENGSIHERKGSIYPERWVTIIEDDEMILPSWNSNLSRRLILHTSCLRCRNGVLGSIYHKYTHLLRQAYQMVVPSFLQRLRDTRMFITASKIKKDSEHCLTLLHA